ncbi:MAG: hypothetical protein JWP76_1086 [Dactylosporangium sp.]|nr:hypothetical protein [Dactylosporangium sp.]
MTLGALRYTLQPWAIPHAAAASTSSAVTSSVPWSTKVSLLIQSASDAATCSPSATSTGKR